MLYILVGPSGSGKTTLLRLACENRPNVTINVKRTNRMRRSDDLDILTCSADSLNDCFLNPKNYYVYSLYNNIYVIEKSQISKALQENKIHLLICSDFSTIKKLKKDYKGQVKTIFIYSNEQDINEIFYERNTLENEKMSRINCNTAIMQFYRNNPDFFDFTIINDSNIDVLWQNMQSILDIH